MAKGSQPVVAAGRRSRPPTRTGRKLLLALSVVLLTVAMAAGCSSSKSSGGSGSASGNGKAIKIAIVADLTGPAPAIGSAAASFQAAIAQINAKGGINGHKINTTIHDTTGTSTGVATATRAAIEDHPDALFITSNMTTPALPPIFQAKITTMSIPAVKTALSPTPNPYFFTTQPDASLIGGVLANGLIRVAGGSVQGKKIAVVTIKNSQNEIYRADAKKALTAAGATIVADFERELTATTFTSEAQKIVSGGAQYVLDISDLTIANTLSSLHTAGYKGPIVTGNGLATPQFFDLTKDPTFNAFTVYKLPWETPEYINALKSTGFYGKAQPDSNALAPGGWAGAYALAMAFQKCGGPCSGLDLAHALETMGPYTPPEGIAFAPFHYTSTSHFGATAANFYVWSTSENKPIPTGDPIKVTG